MNKYIWHETDGVRWTLLTEEELDRLAFPPYRWWIMPLGAFLLASFAAAMTGHFVLQLY